MSFGRLGGTFALLFAGHQVADHWVQTRRQACAKGGEGWPARVACARHVASLTAVQALFLAAAAAASGERLSARRVVVGLSVNAVSHYWADRRTTLARLADRVGKGEFAELGDGSAAPAGTGAYALDQAFHVGMLAVAAAIIAGKVSE